MFLFKKKKKREEKVVPVYIDDDVITEDLTAENQNGKFEIVQKILEIHTEEVI